MSTNPECEEQLFCAAAPMTTDERAVFLTLKCGHDSNLRRRIDSLLAAHDAKPRFMEDPVARPRDREPIRLMLDDPDTQIVGQTIGRYKLLEKIGEGGCGVVYVAEQSTPIRRRVALKVIKLGMDTKQVIARFEAERQALALMDHPNIAKVLDAGATETGRPYFVMELVRGIRITDYCDQHHLNTPERLDLFVRACHAIQHAHQKGIIHRDIKPSNILVTLHDGVPVPKVIDFGIAKATEGRLTDSTVYTQLHQFIGTPAYMSPEQAEMSGLDIDTRSDIYSLGVLLYELLAGRTPFDSREFLAAGIDAMRRFIREREPVRPSTRLTTLPPEELTRTASRRSVDTSKLLHQLRGDLDWIVMKCLEKDRTRRYETANGLAMDIDRHRNNEPVVARPPSKTYRFIKTVRRNTGAFVAVAAVLAALLIGIIVSLSQMVRARSAENQFREEARKALVAEGLAREERIRAETSLYAGDMYLVQQALQQQNLRHARELLRAHEPKNGDVDRRGWEWRYYSHLSRGNDTFSIRSNGNHVVSTVRSTLLNGVILGWKSGTLELWNLASARSPTILAQIEGGLQAVLLDADGRTLLTHSRDGTVRIWRLDNNGNLNLIHSFRSAGVIRAFSAARELITVVFKPAERVELPDSDVALTAVIDYDTGERIDLPNSGGESLFSHDGKFLVTGSWHGALTVWSTADWTQQLKLPNSGRLITMALSTNARWLVTGSWEGSLILWDLATGLPTPLLKNDPLHTRVMRTEISADGSLIATAYSNGTIGLWNLPDRREIAQLEGHEGYVMSMAFSPNGEWLVSSDPATETTRLFKAQQPPGRESNFRMFSRTVFSPDRRTVIVGDLSTNGFHCALQDLISRESKILLAEPNPLGFSKDGYLVTATVSQPLPIKTGRISGLKLWDILSGTLHKSIPFLEGEQEIGAVELSPDGSTVATGDLLGNVTLWDATSGKKKFTLESTGGRVWNLVFTPDGTSLAVGVATEVQGAVTLWDLQKRKIDFSLPGMGSPVAISPDGKTLAMATEKEVVLVKIATKEIAPLKGHRERVYWLAFSPDGRTLASAAEDIKLWNIGAGREVGSFRTGSHNLYVTFSPDGRHLLGGSVGQGHIWSAEDPKAN